MAVARTGMTLVSLLYTSRPDIVFFGDSRPSFGSVGGSGVGWIGPIINGVSSAPFDDAYLHPASARGRIWQGVSCFTFLTKYDSIILHRPWRLCMVAATDRVT